MDNPYCDLPFGAWFCIARYVDGRPGFRSWWWNNIVLSIQPS